MHWNKRLNYDINLMRDLDGPYEVQIRRSGPFTNLSWVGYHCPPKNKGHTIWVLLSRTFIRLIHSWPFYYLVMKNKVCLSKIQKDSAMCVQSKVEKRKQTFHEYWLVTIHSTLFKQIGPKHFQEFTEQSGWRLYFDWWTSGKSIIWSPKRYLCLTKTNGTWLHFLILIVILRFAIKTFDKINNFEAFLWQIDQY